MKFKVGDKVFYRTRKYVVTAVDCNTCGLTDDKGCVIWAIKEDLKLVKPTIDDLRDYMLEHFVDNNGNLDVCGLDFSNFEGNVYITELKCGGGLSQSGHKVNGDLYQSGHEIDGDLFQNHINVKQDYNCYNIKYGGNIYIDEPQKTLKEITKEELEELGYKLKG